MRDVSTPFDMTKIDAGAAVVIVGRISHRRDTTAFQAVP
jgi:hypothetical protein